MSSLGRSVGKVVLGNEIRLVVELFDGRWQRWCGCKLLVGVDGVSKEDNVFVG